MWRGFPRVSVGFRWGLWESWRASALPCQSSSVRWHLTMPRSSWRLRPPSSARRSSPALSDTLRCGMKRNAKPRWNPLPLLNRVVARFVARRPAYPGFCWSVAGLISLCAEELALIACRTPENGGCRKYPSCLEKEKFMRPRIAVVLFASLLVLGLVGCSKKEQPAQTPPAATGQEAQQTQTPP